MSTTPATPPSPLSTSLADLFQALTAVVMYGSFIFAGVAVCEQTIKCETWQKQFTACRAGECRADLTHTRPMACSYPK